MTASLTWSILLGQGACNCRLMSETWSHVHLAGYPIGVLRSLICVLDNDTALHVQHALLEAMNGLKTETFEQAMQIILHRHPGLLQANTEVLNIDFGPLDALTLRQLAAFCHFCLKGNSPESARSWPGLLFGAGGHTYNASLYL